MDTLGTDDLRLTTEAEADQQAASARAFLGLIAAAEARGYLEAITALRRDGGVSFGEAADWLESEAFPPSGETQQALRDVEAEAEARGREQGRRGEQFVATKLAERARREYPLPPFVSMDFVNGVEWLADQLEMGPGFLESTRGPE